MNALGLAAVESLTRAVVVVVVVVCKGLWVDMSIQNHSNMNASLQLRLLTGITFVIDFSDAIQ